MRRRAVIDIGTNSVRLLVVDVDGDHVVPVERDVAMPRLGRGVDEHRRLSDEAMSATVTAIEHLVARARVHRAASITVVGTSALRDAANRDEFAARVRDRTGLAVTVLSGREEASLAFLGAVRGLPRAPADVSGNPGIGNADTGDDRAREVFVIDVGGGSTEVVRGTADGVMDVAVSLDVGAVRMTESCVHSDPISEPDWDRLVAKVREELRPLSRALSARPDASLPAAARTSPASPSPASPSQASPIPASRSPARSAQALPGSTWSVAAPPGSAGSVAAASRSAGSVAAASRSTASVAAAPPGGPARSADRRLFIGLGGTATTLAAMYQQLRTYDSDRVHGFVLSRAEVADLIEKLRVAPVAERRAWPGLQPERADIVLAGAVIIHQVMVRLGVNRLTVSESDLLAGVLIGGAGDRNASAPSGLRA